MRREPHLGSIQEHSRIYGSMAGTIKGVSLITVKHLPMTLLNISIHRTTVDTLTHVIPRPFQVKARNELHTVDTRTSRKHVLISMDLILTRSRAELSFRSL